MSSTRVLVVDDQVLVARAMAAMAKAAGHDVVVCHDVETALQRFEAEPFDAVLSDVKMGTLGGFDLLKGVREHARAVPVVLITGEATVNAAMAAIEQGAFDYLSKPVRHDELSRLLKRAIDHKNLLSRERLEETVDDARETTLHDIIGHSPLMLDAFKTVALAARGDAPVLILGENGTGKEMVAKALHERSPRADKPFVPVNMAAISHGIAESELFGHARGAFTDARERRTGLFQHANGGTLFLDEIGDLDMGIQVKLLRAIQERRIKPAGSDEEVEVDIRLVSATNRNLKQRVASGDFREDLYFRLNVVTITLPPLRHRREDIPKLAECFLARYARKLHRRVPRLAPDALEALNTHAWPGNVRELENVMQRAVQFCTDGIVTVDLLKLDYAPPPTGAGSTLPGRVLTMNEKMDEYVLEVLDRAGGNLTQAAKILDVSRRTLQRRAARLRHATDGSDNLSQ